MHPPVLQQLREQTRPAHLALEAQPALKRLLSSRLTNREYGHLLQSMLAFYHSLESELIPATAALLERYPAADYRYLARAPLLASDCRALGHDSSGFTHSPIAFCLDGSAACLLGVLYVIEGSTQGGRLIARHLSDTLGVGRNSGASFFNIGRRDNSWAAFRRWLAQDLVYSYQNDVKHVVAGANMTFSALHAHLDQWRRFSHER
ncbi:biliverdin-producing heme oxygenase [Kineobactrum salinum]|uniref:Biliverdin-producing heme oxygenase n=1 Tax=Kineobactrum salinum TaxID=2708301 RepID=A0A6C0U026_9GAMM|nr:biliverdin-producing heme oxygenase [Kineobactrum salinum]QIB65452.1 biliverdin-producing heme oxygenase [Kineobactrum salinum]